MLISGNIIIVGQLTRCLLLVDKRYPPQHVPAS
jgi:hypothetical protein